MPHRTDPPDVSVVVPAWCAAGQLETSVGSALAQHGVTLEVVIIDDASPDGTLDEALRLAKQHPEVRVWRLGRNGGPSAARNAALDRAEGRWIAVLDADDRMVPDRLRKMVTLAEEKEADVILGNLRSMRAEETPLSAPPLLPDQVDPSELSLAQFIAGNMPRDGDRSLGYLKPLIRREFLERNGLRYDPALRNGEDFHLILATYAAGGRVWLSPEPDYLYTRRAGSLSHRSAPEHLSALLEAERRIAARLPATPELRRLLAQRRRALSQVMTAETVMQSLKSRDLRQAGASLMARPDASGQLGLKLWEAATKRAESFRRTIFMQPGEVRKDSRP